MPHKSSKKTTATKSKKNNKKHSKINDIAAAISSLKQELLKLQFRAIGLLVLEPRKTWRQQPPLLHCQAVALAQERPWFFRKFVNGWSIQDILKQYLLNMKSDSKGRLGDDWNSKNESDSDNSDSEVEKNEDLMLDKSSEGGEDVEVEIELKIDSASDEAEVPNTLPRKRRTGTGFTSKAKPSSKKTQTSHTTSATTISHKKKRTHDGDDHWHPKMKCLSNGDSNFQNEDNEGSDNDGATTSQTVGHLSLLSPRSVLGQPDIAQDVQDDESSLTQHIVTKCSNNDCKDSLLQNLWNEGIYAPITVEQFAHFVLIPNIDRGMSFNEAYEEMLASADVGQVLQHLEDTGKDTEIDDLTMTAVRLGRNSGELKGKAKATTINTGKTGTSGGCGVVRATPVSTPVDKEAPTADLAMQAGSSQFSGCLDDESQHGASIRFAGEET
ncbi:hypothetical protein PAXINDRAFT_153325 [Paxillus involutus ATCC 200175]|nr:hypothetical protein PAXINDRAFT_153325 [Paxillus involutus ATCC 200175]